MVRLAKLPLARPRTLLARLFGTQVLVILVTLGVIGLAFRQLIVQYFLNAGEISRLNQASRAVQLVAAPLAAGESGRLQDLVTTLAVSFDAEVWVLDGDGRIVARSQAGRVQPQISVAPSEIQAVLRGNTVLKKAVGRTGQSQVVGLPVPEPPAEPPAAGDAPSPPGDSPQQAPAIIGALIMRSPLAGVRETVSQLSELLLEAAVVAILVAGLFAFSLSKVIVRPIQRVNRATLDLAAGKLDRRVPVPPETEPEELRRLAITFNLAADRIEAAFREKQRVDVIRRDFVANVSHEFKAPLTSLQGFIEMMAEGLLSDEERQRYTRLMLSDVAHLSRLVEDLLELSHLESGTLKLQKVPLEPGLLVEWAVEEMADRAADAGLQLEQHVEPGLPAVLVDRVRFRQVLINLLDNAIRHTPAGGRIAVSAEPAGPDHVRFSIRDTGQGIPPEALPHVWDRFYKADRARTPRQDGGSGLGLAIVKQIVELHGGRAEIRSELGQGTTVRVEVAAAGEGRPPDRAEDRAEDRAASQGRPPDRAAAGHVQAAGQGEASA